MNDWILHDPKISNYEVVAAHLINCSVSNSVKCECGLIQKLPLWYWASRTHGAKCLQCNSLLRFSRQKAQIPFGMISDNYR